MFGKMDPFVQFTVEHQIYQSETKLNAGKYPKWGQKIAFRCKNTDLIKVALFDEESNGKDDLIGNGEYCYELTDRECLFKPQNVNIQIYYKDKNAGELKITANFYSDSKKQRNLQQQL